MTDDNGTPASDDGADTEAEEATDSGVPEDAFISPDDPIVRRKVEAVPDDAFISPDEPIVRSTEPMIGTVVGMDGTAIHSASRSSIHLDQEQVAQILDETSRSIREEGVRAGLQATPDAPRFEVMLKAYLAGYFSRG